jgi:hypothetical protein
VATKSDLLEWVVDALNSLGGSGRVAEVCKVIWDKHELELRVSGLFFYTWQYDARWAAQTLRDEQVLLPHDPRVRQWVLA